MWTDRQKKNRKDKTRTGTNKQHTTNKHLTKRSQRTNRSSTSKGDKCEMGKEDWEINKEHLQVEAGAERD